MTNEEWFETLTAELLAQSPFRRSEYFKRFASGALTREQVWGHIGQWYFLIAWFPRIFSGIHARCEDLEVRKDCARHLLVEDLGYFQGTVGGALVQHYDVRPAWGGSNYTVHELVEQEEAGETKAAILRHLRTVDDRRAAEAAMREMHRLLEAYADSLTRRHLAG